MTVVPPGASAKFREVYRPQLWEWIYLSLFAVFFALLVLVARFFGWESGSARWYDLAASLLGMRPDDNLYSLAATLLILIFIYLNKGETAIVTDDMLVVGRDRYVFGYAQIKRVIPVTFDVGRRGDINVKTAGQDFMDVWAPMSFTNLLLYSIEGVGVVVEFVDQSKPILLPSHRQQELLAALEPLVARRKSEGLPEYSPSSVTVHGLKAQDRLVREAKKEILWPYVLFAATGIWLISSATVALVPPVWGVAVIIALVAVIDIFGGFWVGKMARNNEIRNGTALAIAVIFWQLLSLGNARSGQLPLVIGLVVIAVPATLSGAAIAARSRRSTPK